MSKSKKPSSRQQPKKSPRKPKNRSIDTGKDPIIKATNTPKSPSQVGGIKAWVSRKIISRSNRVKSFLSRRPHRSFKLTKRRDYKRPLKLPGYFAFTIEVTRTIWGHKWLFLRLLLVFFVLIVLFGLMGQQDIYEQMRTMLNDTAPESLFSGVSGEIGKAGIILLTAVTSGLTTNLDSGQIIIASLFGLYIWLTVVWLLRKIIARKRVLLRDGLYSAGSPILPTMLMFLVLLIQMVPGAIAIIIASAAWQSGLVEGGVFSMLVSIALVLIMILSLYWMVSTFVALVVVTLPGMYPMRALAISGDLVIGRRLRLMYRIIWMMAVVVSWWVVVMIPIILFDGWIKSVFEQISWLPIVPVTMLILSIVTIIWSCSYVYLLYRKVVDDDAAPA